jgi:hypothetical protein
MDEKMQQIQELLLKNFKKLSGNRFSEVKFSRFGSY